MKRTLRLGSCSTKYRGKQYDGIISCILQHLGMTEYGKYVVTITESSKGKYRFRSSSRGIWDLYNGAEATEDCFVGGFCYDVFTKIFFELDEDKIYNITVKKVD